MNTEATCTPAPSELDVVQVGPVWQTRSQTRLLAALAKAQGDLQAAMKDGEDNRGNKYATEAALRDAVNIALAPSGLSVQQWPQTVPSEKSTGWTVILTTRLGHSSGEFVQTDCVFPVDKGSGGTRLVQDIGSAITFACRYTIGRATGAFSGDGDEHVDRMLRRDDRRGREAAERDLKKKHQQRTASEADRTTQDHERETAARTNARRERFTSIADEYGYGIEAVEKWLTEKHQQNVNYGLWEEPLLHLVAGLLRTAGAAGIDLPEIDVWLGSTQPIGHMGPRGWSACLEDVKANGWADKVRQRNRDALAAR